MSELRLDEIMWSPGMTQQMDEVWLQCAEQVGAAMHDRIQRDMQLLCVATEFRRFAYDLFLELWPKDDRTGLPTYLASIKSDIHKLPLDLIDGLVDALVERAATCGAHQPTAGSAALMLAGWLRARAVELRSEGAVRDLARKLKHEHARLYNELFLNQYGFMRHEQLEARDGQPGPCPRA